jgi:hypothetical protein
MSSSNRVRIAGIEESTLGVTPPTGNFSTARYTNESLSGTPTTTESNQIRDDRQSSGQIVTGLEVGGELGFELAKDPFFEELLESVMMSEWDIQAPFTLDLELDIDDTDPLRPIVTLARTTGDWNTTLDRGDIFSTSGFTEPENNTDFQVLEIVSPLIIRVNPSVVKGNVQAAIKTGVTVKRADRLFTGTLKKPYSFEKAFLDLDEKALIYKGMLGNTLNINVAYGEVITGSIGFVGTERIQANGASEFITDGRTITPAATTASMNGSIDMPFLSSSAVGELLPVDFCIQSISINLDNNNNPRTCIGRIGPKDYSPGTASVGVSLSAYLADDSWGLLARKLDQVSFSLGGLIRNGDGGYGFFLPAVQVSFDDPQVGGSNQEISLDMDGNAKIGENNENSFYLYRL